MEKQCNYFGVYKLDSKNPGKEKRPCCCQYFSSVSLSDVQFHLCIWFVFSPGWECLFSNCLIILNSLEGMLSEKKAILHNALADDEIWGFLPWHRDCKNVYVLQRRGLFVRDLLADLSYYVLKTVTQGLRLI